MPRNKYPEQTVEKILDAAAALFAEKGYQSTTLQDIIDATGSFQGGGVPSFPLQGGDRPEGGRPHGG